MNTQIPVNVLSNNAREKEDTINQLASIIKSSGCNRSQRRRFEKALKKTENITAQVQKNVNTKAYKEYQDAVDRDYVHFFACLGLTMMESYHWQESEDNDHGQITSLFERVNKTIQKYSDMGYSTEDIVNLLDERTGIRLVTEAH